MSWPPTVRQGVQVEGTGPGVSNHHQVAGYHLFVGGKWAPRRLEAQRDPETLDPSALQGVREFDPVTLEEARGWIGLPDSKRMPKEAALTIQPLARGREGMNRGREGTPAVLHALVYASGRGGYDRVRICRSKNAARPLADLGVGEWSDWWLDRFEIDGRKVRGYVRAKLITLSARADAFELFIPQIWPPDGYTKPASVAREIDRHVGNFLQNPARDALGLIDDDTYFELLEFHHERLADVAEYLAGSRDWDLLMTETHASDYTSHFFLRAADPHSGAPPSVQRRCREGVERTYASIDRWIGRLRRLADDDTAFFVVSDHGGTSQQHTVVNVAAVLEQAGFLKYQDGGRNRRIDWTRTRAADVGLVHIFVNLKGREPGGIVDPGDYDATCREIIQALHDYEDPETGRQALRPRPDAGGRGDGEPVVGPGGRRGLRPAPGVRRRPRQAAALGRLRHGRPALDLHRRRRRRARLGRAATPGARHRRGAHDLLPHGGADAAQRRGRGDLRGGEGPGPAPGGVRGGAARTPMTA